MHGLRISPFILLMKIKEVLDHARKLYLSQKGEPWVNKNDLYFDVPRDVLMEQRRCDLVGLYLLSKLENLIDHTHVGLYRDDWLAVVNLSGVQIERLRKQIFKLFKSLDLLVTIDVNITATDYLDLYLDLRENSYKP